MIKLINRKGEAVYIEPLSKEVFNKAVMAKSGGVKVSRKSIKYKLTTKI